MAKVVLLNSGGIDSALLAAKGELDGHEVHSLFVDSQQVNRTATLAAAATTASNFCTSHRVVVIDFGGTSNYWQDNGMTVDPTRAVTMYGALTAQENAERKATWPWQAFHVLPNMGFIVASLGMAYAKVLGAPMVITGHRLIISESTTDKYNELYEMNPHISMMANKPALLTPIWDLQTYADVATYVYGTLNPTKVTMLRNTYSYTHSCRWNTPCGVCGKCLARAEMGL